MKKSDLKEIAEIMSSRGAEKDQIGRALIELSANSVPLGFAFVGTKTPAEFADFVRGVS